MIGQKLAVRYRDVYRKTCEAFKAYHHGNE